MAKSIKISTTTTTTTIDVELEKDRNDIIRLRRVTKPIQSEMDMIYRLYKKYIDADAPMYCSSCNGGPFNSIQRYYWKVVNLSI